MAGLEDVLERLSNDPDFKAALATDPQTALADYDLTSDDLTLLAHQLSPDQSGQSAAERHTSKTGFLALFSQPDSHPQTCRPTPSPTEQES